MTIQQKLAERMYELLPHKKELEFSTLVHNKKDSDSEVGIVYLTSLGLVHIIERINDGGDIFWNKTELKHEDIDVIGQPLRLADVLQVVENISGVKIEVLLSSLTPTSYTIINMISKYNVSKDNILDQSDEFCQFIYDLIK